MRDAVHRILLVLATALFPAVAAGQEPGSVSVSGVRVALTQLAIGTSGGNSVAAELGTGAAVHLQAGSFTLESLSEAVAASDTPEAFIRQDGHYRAVLPVVVLPGASLTIGPGESLFLDRTRGSFILSLGRLEIMEAEVGSIGDPHPSIDGYRPFLAGIGRTSLRVQDSTLSSLGYGGSDATAGLYLGGRGLLSGGTPDAMTGNQFTDVRGVVVSDADGVVISDNSFSWMRGSALEVRGSRDATVSGNQIVATGGGHALRISGGANQTVTDNRLTTGRGKGARIDDDAHGTRFTGNSIHGYGGTGLTVAERATCVLVSDNVVANNNGAGLRLWGAGAFILSGNRLEENDGPAIEIARQLPDTRGTIVDNILDGNRQGIRASQIGRLDIARNDLSGQMPRLLAGDLEQHAADWLRTLRDRGTTTLVATGVRARFDAEAPADAATRAFDSCRTTEKH